jgi:hypothetical protein
VGGSPPRLHVEWNSIRFPDSWVLRHFGDPSPPESTPNADPDADGLSNLEEYVAGSDPKDTSSAPRLQLQPLPGGVVRIVYATEAASGPDYAGRTRYYDLQSHRRLDEPWAGVLHETSVLGDGNVHQTTLSIADNGRFYRLRIRLQ